MVTFLGVNRNTQPRRGEEKTKVPPQRAFFLRGIPKKYVFRKIPGWRSARAKLGVPFHLTIPYTLKPCVYMCVRVLTYQLRILHGDSGVCWPEKDPRRGWPPHGRISVSGRLYAGVFEVWEGFYTRMRLGRLRGEFCGLNEMVIVLSKNGWWSRVDCGHIFIRCILLL